MIDILKSITLSDDKTLEEKLLTVFGTITYIIIGLYTFGIINAQPSTLLGFNFVLKVFTSIYLIYRFNSWSKTKMEFTNLDRKLVVGVSIFSLIVSFSDFIIVYINYIRNLSLSILQAKLGDVVKN
jgi:uncharacterized membrane protein